jgi:hypothetical protein
LSTKPTSPPSPDPETDLELGLEASLEVGLESGPEAAPEPAADPMPRRRPRIREAPAMRYLMDNHLFRHLIAAGHEEALAAFRASVAKHGLSAEEELPALKLSPLGFLDVTGIEPPHYDPFPLPPKVLKGGESLMATTVVVKLVVERYREAAEIKPEVFRKRVEEMRQATPEWAWDLFDLVLTRFVEREGFQEEVYSQLAFDYMYKFPFPEVLREEIFDFLCASLFAAGETVSGLSKMRMIKVIWDRAYERLLKRNPAERAEVQALDREMRLWSRQDFLDWEVIHYATLGHAGKGQIQPVTSFALDSAERLKARVVAYKSALRSFLDQIDREDLANIRSRLDAWQPGVLVPVREDGTIEAVIPTGDLPVFMSAKREARESAAETE